MKTDTLWAKSKRDDEPEYPSMLLAGHLADVYEAAARVCKASGDDQLRALGLEPAMYADRLRACVLLGAVVHDLGKANDHFQGMITGRRNVQQNPQGLRHEWVSLLLLKDLKTWLLPAVGGSERDFGIVEWAVAGHHPSRGHDSPPTSCPAGSGAEILMLSGCPDFSSTLEWFRGILRLDQAPVLQSTKRDLVGYNSVFNLLALWKKSAVRAWDQQIVMSAERKFVAAVKASLIAADVAGSALPKAKPDDPARWEWIDHAFASKPQPGDLQRVATHRLGGAGPRHFQTKLAESGSPVTYVKAGCGTGKTVGAYLWAAQNHPGRRLYFCYPTTGTATEGFKDYLHEPEGELDNIGARLFHSRRDIDLEIILNTGSDNLDPEADSAARLESLEAWSTPIVACTADSVLGLLQNNRRGLYAWPALAQSAFVFDEIHAYDDRLFGALLRFLRDLPGLPVLLMTASLPEARENALIDLLKQYRDIELRPITGPSELEELPRYHILTAKSGTLEIVQAEISAGGKVLWVCNTVKRVMESADQAEASDLCPLLYHSRFKYVHRVARHKSVVEAFSAESSRPALAVCSQVAEMSLDLKGCTLLVTDLAPVPALIQRLGRLNRQARPGDPTRPFVLIEPGDHLPYSPPEIEAARVWVASLPRQQISQRDLVELWKHPADQATTLVSSAWLDGGPTTCVSDLRDGSPGITVLMADDLARMSTPRDSTRFTLPMPPPPRGVNWRSWKKHRGIPIAPAGTILYDPMRGAAWEK